MYFENLLSVDVIQAVGQVKACIFLYTDPGSGALILQLLSAAVIGSLFYFRSFRDRVKHFFSSRKKSEAELPASNLQKDGLGADEKTK